MAETPIDTPIGTPIGTPTGTATITISLPDGSTKELPGGATGADLAASIGTRLAKAAVAVTVDGAATDLTTALPDGATVAIVTADSPTGRYILRHSTAHVLAQAVTDLWPGAKYAIGPAIEDGFYYDFDLPGGAHFSEDDLAASRPGCGRSWPRTSPSSARSTPSTKGWRCSPTSPTRSRSSRASIAAEGASDGVVSAYRNTESASSTCAGARTCRPPGGSATSS